MSDQKMSATIEATVYSQTDEAREVRHVRKELALRFRGRAVANNWKPKTQTFNKMALEFLIGAASGFQALGKNNILPDMLLMLASIRPIDGEFDRWVKVSNEADDQFNAAAKGGVN